MFLFEGENGENIFVRKTISELENDEELINNTTMLRVVYNDYDFYFTRMNLEKFLENERNDKLRKQFASSWLITEQIVDMSLKSNLMGMLIFNYD